MAPGVEIVPPPGSVTPPIVATVRIASGPDIRPPNVVPAPVPSTVTLPLARLTVNGRRPLNPPVGAPGLDSSKYKLVPSLRKPAPGLVPADVRMFNPPASK